MVIINKKITFGLNKMRKWWIWIFFLIKFGNSQKLHFYEFSIYYKKFNDIICFFHCTLFPSLILDNRRFHCYHCCIGKASKPFLPEFEIGAFAEILKWPAKFGCKRLFWLVPSDLNLQLVNKFMIKVNVFAP